MVNVAYFLAVFAATAAALPAVTPNEVSPLEARAGQVRVELSSSLSPVIYKPC